MSRRRALFHRGAFTLVELLVVLGIVAALAGLAFPVYQRMTQNSRGAACVSNLRQLGAALNLYLGDHNMTMPTLQGGRLLKSDNVPVIDNTLDVYATAAGVFACPADTAGLAAASGTSYYWNTALNRQAVAALNFFLISDESSIPVLSDKQGFHFYAQNKVNLLYADGHATQNLNFTTGK